VVLARWPSHSCERSKISAYRLVSFSDKKISIVAVSVFGLGGLVATATAVALYVGLTSAADNTRRLLSSQAELLVDVLERRVESQLIPVTEQSRWLAELVSKRLVDPDDDTTLDALVAGALAATPQVAGIAVVKEDGTSRRWQREPRETIAEDWSGRAEIRSWIEAGKSQDGGIWARPFWTETIGATVVLYHRPLRVDGEFYGMLGQIVPISDLSHQLSTISYSSAMTPFILYDKDRVLAHPLLINRKQEADDAGLLSIEEIADGVLTRIWSPDEENPNFLQHLERSKASRITTKGLDHLLLYRDIQRFGPKPWTVGTHVDSRAYGGTFERLRTALLAGVGVLVFSALIAAYFGHRVSHPIRAMAAAARKVTEDDLDEVTSLPSSRIHEIDLATGSFNHMVEGLRERRLIRETLGRFVPETVARKLLSAGGKVEASHHHATVLFSDLAGFTPLTETLGPDGIVAVLNEYFEIMVNILERHGGVVIQFQGDAILATFNVPIERDDHPQCAIEAVAEMDAAIASREFAGQKLKQRIGISTGPLHAGAIGSSGRLSYTVHGDAVNLAARLEVLNKEYGTQILVAGETVEHVEGFNFRHLGEATVRGQTKAIALYELVV